MEKVKRSAPPSLLALGIIFLIVGFVQQGFTFSFESGMFSLGIIFTLSGLVGTYLPKGSGEEE
jgi:hypothetical protein